MKKTDKVTKPEFQKQGFFSYENLMSKSLRTLYKIRKAERDSQGSFRWYLYPGNFPRAIQYCIEQKKFELKQKDNLV